MMRKSSPVWDGNKWVKRDEHEFYRRVRERSEPKFVQTRSGHFAPYDEGEARAWDYAYFATDEDRFPEDGND